MATNLALVGGAHIHTPGFIKRLNDRSEFTVKYVWDHDPQRARARAEALKAQPVADLETIWKDASIPAVVICSETDRHEALVQSAAAAKKHMFVEKPLGLGAKDAYSMASVIQQTGVLFQTGYFMRGDPNHLFLREQIKAGVFGKITRMRTSNCHSGSLGGWFDTEWRWMADPAIAGVGAYGDLGTHVLDIMLWMLGEVERVTADLDVAISRYKDCDEYGEGLLKFKNGAIGALAAGWVDVANPVSLELCGTTAHATVVSGKLYFQCEKIPGADGKTPWTDLPKALPHAFELFLDAVNGKKDVPLVTAQEAAYRSAVMEAMYKAARKHAWVKPE